MSKKVQRVTASSIRQIFSVERGHVLTAKNHAFKTAFDTSRAISPPQTMLAELEINLWYEGYNTTFDESEHKYYATHPIPYPEVDEDGNEYIEEYYPEPYEETILELLEKHTSEFSRHILMAAK